MNPGHIRGGLLHYKKRKERNNEESLPQHNIVSTAATGESSINFRIGRVRGPSRPVQHRNGFACPPNVGEIDVADKHLLVVARFNDSAPKRGNHGGMSDTGGPSSCPAAVSPPGRAWSAAIMKLVESRARAVTRVRHWSSFPGPSCQDAGTTITSAPNLARLINCSGKRMS